MYRVRAREADSLNVIGQTKEQMDTPALLIDLDVMEKNSKHMADFFKNAKARLRAHTKVHRCPAIAHRQIEAGAKGICCQKVGEAEVMAEAGIRDIIVTNEIVTPPKIKRLLSLAALCKISVPVDNAANADVLSSLAARSGKRLDVLIDIHMGSNRCGVEPGEPALKLAKHVKKLRGLNIIGLMGFEGHISSMMPRKKRRAECEKLERLLIDTKGLLERNDISVGEVSTGTTGTYDVTANFPGVTEVQAGTYVLMDLPYHQHVPEFECAMHVLSTIISTPSPYRAITDAGLMSMNTSSGLPALLDHRDVEVADLHAENAILKSKKPLRFKIGEKVEFLPTYLDGTVNLFDRFYATRRGRIEAVWSIAGRGRSF